MTLYSTMNSTSYSNSHSMANPSTSNDVSGSGSGKKVRKPYTITKSRESWTDEEHDKFLEALQLFDRDWKKIEDFVGSKTVIQIRSHAQKYFLKVQKNGTIAHVPPPRPKRKAAHPYPQKAPKNVLVPLQASFAYPSSVNSLASGYHSWDEASMLMNAPSGTFSSQDNLQGAEVMRMVLNLPFLSNLSTELEFVEEKFPTLIVTCNITDSADIGSRGATRIINSRISGIESTSRAVSTPELQKHGQQGSLLHGIPDFSEVYSFIGSVFDPSSQGHAQKLKEMDPINFETVLLLMRNLTVNLSDPDFEPIKIVLSSYDANAKTVGITACNFGNYPANDVSC